MTTLIQIGSCGVSWPENTTPIQRLKAIAPEFDRVILIDREPDSTPYVRCDKYFQVKRLTPLSISRVLHLYREDKLVVWFGPSSRIAIIVLLLQLIMPFRFVLDLYDHENLSSGVARARGAWFRAIRYQMLEGFTKLAARRANLLVSAISENRYVYQSNRVKAINGVATEALSNIQNASGPERKQGQRRITICYVGLINAERAGLLADIAEASYGIPVELTLVGDNDPTFLDLLRKRAARRGEVSIEAPGFLPWHEAMRFVSGADLCIYLFPTRPELDCVYPIKMGEYMKLGKPVIATDSTAIREVFGGCQGVLRCDPNRPDTWISAIGVLARDPDIRCEYGRANNAFAQKELDWTHTQAILLRRLHNLIGSASDRRSL